jgi:hypothetical protein
MAWAWRLAAPGETIGGTSIAFAFPASDGVMHVRVVSSDPACE